MKIYTISLDLNETIVADSQEEALGIAEEMIMNGGLNMQVVDENPACPECEAELIHRASHGRNGRKTGFYACPNCDYKEGI